MVLESLTNPFLAEKKPFRLFWLGLVYSSIGIYLAQLVFSAYASLVAVFFTVMVCVPLMYNTLKFEEHKDLEINEERTLLKEHAKALWFFIVLFLGMVVSFSLWYVVLPESTISAVFSVQTQTISSINNKAVGHFLDGLPVFSNIFFNNMRVLVFCILFSFVYGAGAIFILTWNASVIGVAIGNIIREEMAKAASLLGMAKVATYLNIVSYGLLRYALHGIPEITAYFVGGLAGGIISVAVVKHHITTKRFSAIVLDSTELLALSVLILVVAAVLEVYVTPVLF